MQYACLSAFAALKLNPGAWRQGAPEVTPAGQAALAALSAALDRLRRHVPALDGAGDPPARPNQAGGAHRFVVQRSRPGSRHRDLAVHELRAGPAERAGPPDPAAGRPRAEAAALAGRQGPQATACRSPGHRRRPPDDDPRLQGLGVPRGSHGGREPGLHPRRSPSPKCPPPNGMVTAGGQPRRNRPGRAQRGAGVPLLRGDVAGKGPPGVLRRHCEVQRHARPLSKFLDRLAPSAGDGHAIDGPAAGPRRLAHSRDFSGTPRFSSEAVALYESCGRRFLYTHLLQVGGRRRMSAFMLMHEAIREVYRAVVAQGVASAGQCEALLSQAFVTHGLHDHGYVEDYRAMASTMLGYFLESRAGALVEPPPRCASPSTTTKWRSGRTKSWCVTAFGRFAGSRPGTHRARTARTSAPRRSSWRPVLRFRMRAWSWCTWPTPTQSPWFCRPGSLSTREAKLGTSFATSAVGLSGLRRRHDVPQLPSFLRVWRRAAGDLGEGLLKKFTGLSGGSD
jgi:hypothetical protein